MALYSEVQIDELRKKTEGIHLDDISLSTRLYNCLRRNGVNTLFDLMLKTEDELQKFRNMGKQSMDEVIGLRSFILHSDRVTILSFIDQTANSKFSSNNGQIQSGREKLFVRIFGDIKDKNLFFKNKNGQLVDDLNLDSLSLSTRTYNSFINVGKYSLKEIGEMPVSDVLGINNLGRNSFNEVVTVIKLCTEFVDVEISEKNKKIAEKIVEVFSIFIKDEEREVFTKGLAFEITELIKSDEEGLLGKDALQIIKKSNRMMNLFMTHIFEYIQVNEEVSRHALYVEYSELCKYGNLTDLIIEVLIQRKLICENGNYLQVYKCSLREWINSVNENHATAIRLRCEGKTLEEVGNELGVTRERVRQIVSKELNRRPELLEDKYAEIFKKYNFSDEEFRILLEIDTFTINYLRLAYKKGNGTVQELLSDESFPNRFKTNISKAFKNSIFIIDGKCFPLKREVILKELLRTYFSDKDCTIDEFEAFYNKYLQNHELDDEKLLFPSTRAFAARMQDYDYTLSKYGRRIRFYDTTLVDINQLIGDLNLFEYMNMEISTYKLLIDKPEVFEKYGVFDEYELHNLLKKKENEISEINIEVNRMPFIIIGNANRYKQVDELLFQLAPISNIELAKEYEERYGVKSETVLANFFSKIDIYLRDSIYDVEQKEMNYLEKKLMREALVKDFYLWEEVERLYQRLTGNTNTDVINAMTAKQLGYKVYSQYIVRDMYPSAESYYRQLFNQNRPIVIDEFDIGIKKQQLFYAVLSMLRDSLDLIEVDKNVYVTYEYFCNHYICISKEAFRNIGEMALNYCKGDYFTLNSLLNNGLSFKDDIFNNIYITGSSLRLIHNVRAVKAADNILYSVGEELSLLGFFESCFHEFEFIGINEFVEYIFNEYKLLVPRTKVLTIIQASEKLYVDGLLQVICRVDNNTNGRKWYQPVYEEMYCKNSLKINEKNTLLSQILWEDRYVELLDKLATDNIHFVSDIFEYDFGTLYGNDSANVSKNTLVSAVEKIVSWIEDITIEEEEEVNLLDCFFK